jgi:hypothetical protein
MGILTSMPALSVLQPQNTPESLVMGLRTTVICALFFAAPVLGFLSFRGFSILPLRIRFPAAFLIPVLLMASQINFRYEKYYSGTNLHIPLLWGLAYVTVWIWILSIPHRRAKMAIAGVAAVLHTALIPLIAIPGVWIVGDLAEPAEMIFMDKRIKAYQTGWGNHSHNGVEVQIVKRGFCLQDVIYRQRFTGLHLKDKAISIRTDDEFVYRVFRNNLEMNSVLVP